MNNENAPLANIIEILEQIIEIVKYEDTDLTWSRFKSIDELINELLDHIKKLEKRDFSKLNDLTLLFAPTASLQEISISSGWASNFLKISKKFDLAIEEIKHEFKKNTQV
ncbi:MAG: hypothetical protein ACFFD7_07610 [Candidatus Thorarchaeota archaeon]